MRRTAASADAVKAMHEAFCAVGDHAETRHPCLAWSAKGNRDRRRKLAARKFRPGFMDDVDEL